MPKAKRQTPFSAKLKQRPPQKPKNLQQRKREYLTEDEIQKLQKAAVQQGRHPIRDEAMVLLMFRHAFRVSELIALCWEQIDLKIRHSTGFYLANLGEDTWAIQSYMGHANIKNTVIYTELSHRYDLKIFGKINRT